MADEYTPKVSAVRGDYAGYGLSRDRRLADFDRFLAAHEAEVRERIAQDIEAEAAAEYCYTLGGNSGPTNGQKKRADTIAWRGKVAARIARGATR
ncbi:hypothetical protein ACFP63_08765 [Oerskovia jenensis]|uniref:Uncharacterized protein n=1 Tax=Oerskovia jenensis TaxID=162169 RepID=A0ABS2LI95_9CELL|nr:hypothetical protein [Oerskovia jenensis]MBM7480144.1 hypothetical protein [Oerskovia jenensis]